MKYLFAHQSFLKPRSSRTFNIFLSTAIGLTTFSVRAQTVLYRENYRDTRLLGAGNAGIAFVDGGLAGFMNPAGIANAKGISFKFIDASFGGNQSFADSYTALSPMLSGGGGEQTLSQKFSPFLGKPLGLQGSFFPYLMAPGMLIGVWDYTDFSLLYSDPVYPRLEANFRNDYGIILGTAKNIGDRLSLGVSVRYQRRKMVNQAFTADTLLTANVQTLMNAFERGDGYGLNAGLQYKQPLGNGQDAGLGLAVEDAGQTRFKASTRGESEPPRQYQSINLGLGYGVSTALVDVRLNFDVHGINERRGNYAKRLFTGALVSLPAIDLRAGLYQGYWTLGVTLKVLPFVEIDATSYAEEMGVVASQHQNRWYLLGFRFGMDLNGVSSSGKKKQKYSLDRF